VATDTPSRTIRVTLSSDPKCCRASTEDVECGEFRRLASSVYVEFRADSPNEFRDPAFRGKHPAQKKQIARLHRFRIDPERLRGHRELNAKFFQPLFGVDRPSAFGGQFLNVRSVHVQHLPGHLTGLDPLIRDLWVRGMSIVWDMLSPEMPGQIADRAPLRTSTTLATRKRNLFFTF